MPTYKNAAEVRAAHPGAYDDLSDAQIEQGLAKQNPAPVNDGALGERYHPNIGDSPDSAFIGELARTGKEAAIGLARSPLDIASGLFNTVRHPLDTLMGIGHTVAHPVEAAENLAAHPREAGSLLGQMVLGPEVPGAANAALAEGPGIVGRGMSAVGRGAEALGTSKALTRARALAPLELVTGHPVAAAISAATPTALEYGGKGLQKLGGSLEGLDLSIGRGADAANLVPESRRLNPARVSTQVRDFGQEMESGAGSWERSPSDNPMVPSRRNPALKGLEESVPENKWANDASAQKSPIEQFYESDPQARGVGGEIAEGRTTGKFPEGKFGLNNVEANKPYETPGSDGFYNNEFGPDEAFRDLGSEDALAMKPSAPTDSLAELSTRMGRAMSPEDASAAFNERFGLKAASPYTVVSYKNGAATVYDAATNRYVGSFDTTDAAHAFVQSQGR